jgi:2-polyprenyl-3-methyl-5-hydroxy-6-metoxy-1,4-benzoquinol methylase
MKTSAMCNLCSHAEAEWYLTKDAIDVVRCRYCGLIFTEKIQHQDDLIKHYSNEYFEPYLKTEAIHLKKRFRKRIEEIKCLAFPGLLLDVGCGAGFFLKLASQMGYTVKGVEISPYAADYARHNLGLPIFKGELVDADFAPESFDIITLWHVLEHVRDPKAFLAQVNCLLKEKGLLALEVPNIGSSAARGAGINWELMAPKEHFYYFDTVTLQQYLEESGFTIIKTQTFFWTTPAMLLRAVADTWKGPCRVLLKFLELLASSLSFIRFRVAPSFLLGDVITVYAVKRRAVSLQK